MPLTASLLAASLALAAEAPAQAETRQPVHTYDSLALTPAGDRIASVDIVHPASGADDAHGVIVVRAAADGSERARFDPCPACTYSGLIWSPDGRTLAFLATDGAAGVVRVELWVEGAIRPLTTIQGVAHSPRFAPDGQSLALLATVAAKKKTGALEAGAAQVGEIGAAPDEQRIAVIPIATGRLRLVSPDDTFVYEYDWVPDGRAFVVTAAKGDGDNNWWIADLAVVDFATGSLRQILHPDFQIAAPRVAPDGKPVAFVGGLMSDFGATGGDLYQAPLAGGAATNLTPGYRGSFTEPLWRGGKLMASAIVVDRASLVALEGAVHEVRVLWSAPATAHAGDGDTGVDIAVSTNGSVMAAAVEDFTRAPALLVGPPRSPRVLSHGNDGIDHALDVRSLRWHTDAGDVQGWLVGPPTRIAGKQYPLIVHVHGGPSAAVLPLYGRDYSLYTTVAEWVGLGYFVLLPNPRGSYGQGEAYTRANIRDFGGGDFRDILAGVDAAENTAPIDDRRLGIHGHSYGCFITMWAVTHTNRFKAAIAGAGLSNWISYYGENGIDTWMLPFFGASMYDDPAAYRSVSPIETIKQAKTPTLLYTGETDVEVPAPQSFEFWHGLRAMGVPTELHVYAGEGHLIQKPEHVLDLRRRLPAFFARYLTP